MSASNTGLGVKVFLALLLLYGTVLTANWCWNKIKSKLRKDEI